MDFNLSEEQELIRKIARDFLSDNCPTSLVKEMEEGDKGYSPELWEAMAKLGWMGLIIPEEYAGGGGTFLDLAVLLEETGRALIPGPFLSTILSGLIILEAGSVKQRKELLPKLAQGKLLMTTAFSEYDNELDPVHLGTRATLEKGGYVINSNTLFTPDVNIVDYIICVARTSDSKGSDGLTLFLVDTKSPGLEYKLVKTMDQEKQFDVVLNNVKVSTENVLGEIGKGWTYIENILLKATVAQAMEMLGGAQRVLDMTADHAKTRVQFGKFIGSYQAIQHHCANMMVDVNGSRFLAYRAAWMLSEGIPCAKECYMTKAWVNDAYYRVIRLGTQVHGGLGVMKEHDMQLYFRHAKVAELSFCTSEFCREKISQEIGL